MNCCMPCGQVNGPNYGILSINSASVYGVHIHGFVVWRINVVQGSEVPVLCTLSTAALRCCAD